MKFLKVCVIVVFLRDASIQLSFRVAAVQTTLPLMVAQPGSAVNSG